MRALILSFFILTASSAFAEEPPAPPVDENGEVKEIIFEEDKVEGDRQTPDKDFEADPTEEDPDSLIELRGGFGDKMIGAGDDY